MALTQTQLDALSLGTAEGRLAVKIDCASPLLYVSGIDPVQLGGEWYQPRAVSGSYFDLTNPANAKTQVIIDDGDYEIETAWSSARFSGSTVYVYVLLRQVGQLGWITAASLTWTCEATAFGGGRCTLKLFGASGHRPRFGLTLGTKDMFPHAPEPGAVFNFRSGGHVVITTGQPINPEKKPTSDRGDMRHMKPLPIDARRKPVGAK